MKPGVKLYGVRGEVQVDLSVSTLDPRPNELVTLDQIAKTIESGTALLGGVKIRTVIPPHPSYENFGVSTCRYRLNLLFNRFGVQNGDLVSDLEAALSAPALIHSCQDLSSPETCYVCSLLHRVQRLRSGTVVPEEP